MYIILYNRSEVDCFFKETGMDRYQIKAYAKINLGLDVVKRLPNGYHQIRTVMQSVNICDELTLEKRGGGISVSTDSDELPVDEDNLVYKAARLMLEKGEISSGVHIHLQKRIPIAAGMAGGSADAAAVMKGINRLYDLNLSPEPLAGYGVRIGADVPYCLMGGTVLAEGIGERLTRLPPMPDCSVLVAKPDINVSTKFVYEHLDTKGISRHPDIDGMCGALHAGALRGIAERMENVLETVTIPAHPIIEILKDKMRELGAMNSLMSGSGPTVFGLFEDRSLARQALIKFQEEYHLRQAFLTEPI